MHNLLFKRLERAFDLTLDLFDSFDENVLSNKLDKLPSNLIGEQVWCIIGARESYFMAIQLGEWNGFNCSLEDNKNKSQVITKLKDSSNSLLNFISESKNQGINIKLVFDLLEHEIQHHGQLIRYVYGNKLNFPESWNKRYTV